MNTDTIQATEKIWHLESIDLSKVFQDVRVAHLNETIDSKNFAINGQSFACGIGTMANSDIHLALDGKARCIRGICGVDDESETFGAAEFIIRSRDNGDVLWRSGIRRRGDEPVHFNISLDNARGIALAMDIRIIMATGSALKSFILEMFPSLWIRNLSLRRRIWDGGFMPPAIRC